MISQNKTEIYLSSLALAIRKCRLCSYGMENVKPSGSRIEFDPHVFSSVDCAQYMIIYQSPGDAEVAESQPFVGEAGLIFDREIESHGLSRLDFYITSLVKCHIRNDNVPDQNSIAACSPVLALELAAIKPKLIITLGRFVFDFMCLESNYDESLGKLRMSRELFGQSYNLFPICWPDTDESMILFQKHIGIVAKAIKSVKK